MSRGTTTVSGDIKVEKHKMKWDPKTLEIRTHSVEKTLEPLVHQVSLSRVCLIITRLIHIDIFQVISGMSHLLSCCCVEGRTTKSFCMINLELVVNLTLHLTRTMFFTLLSLTA